MDSAGSFKGTEGLDETETARLEAVIEERNMIEVLQQALQAVLSVVESQGWKLAEPASDEKSLSAGSILVSLFERRTGISPAEDEDK